MVRRDLDLTVPHLPGHPPAGMKRERRATPRRTPVSRFHTDGTMRGPAAGGFVLSRGPSTAAGNRADRYPEVKSPTAGRSMARGEEAWQER